jgi:hypothetical protein
MSQPQIIALRRLGKPQRPLVFETLESRLALSGVGLESLYAAGFAWHRNLDWTPGTIQGTTTGNPDDDSHGNATWGYGRLAGGDGAGGANPWYQQTQAALVWDASWYGGPGKWAQGDNVLPTAGQTAMEVHGTESPVAKWLNPAGRMVAIDVTGSLTMTWGGGAGGPADLAIVHKHVVSDSYVEYVPLLAQTRDSSGGTSQTVSVSIQDLVLGPRDEIWVTPRYTGSTGWVTLYDQGLTIQLDSYPVAPTAYQEAYVWDRSVDWTPGTQPGTSTGNPDNDLRGNPVWEYVRVTGGDGVGGANPWYKQTQSLQVWDNDWYGQAGRWVKADNTLPTVTQTGMEIRGTDSPMAKWLNPTGKPVMIDLAGSLTLSWRGGANGNVDLAVVHKSVRKK